MSVRLHPQTRKRLNTAVEILLEWYRLNQRSYIWRGLRKTPYQIMVSEFMLQQTQASQIEKLLPPFLKKFPTVRALAEAESSDVIRAWQGLGYNRRALNLHRAAQTLATKRAFPRTQQELIALPGIGAYTSAAILAFAYNEDVSVVDVNVERVLSRLWQRMPDRDAALPIKTITELNAQILPQGRSSKWHESLMDFGASICTKRKPACEVCPLLEICASGKHFIKTPDLAVRAKAQEVRYAGQPRRIWRGRILKIISEANGITRAGIERSLSRSHAEIDPALIDTILFALTSEGFIKRRATTYLLA